MYLVSVGSSAAPKIDPAMIRFWGKPMSDWDFQVCKALGWITAQGGGSQVCWHPREDVKAFKGQVYSRGKPVKYTVCDDVLRDFVCHYLIRCLDQSIFRNVREKAAFTLTADFSEFGFSWFRRIRGFRRGNYVCRNA